MNSLSLLKELFNHMHWADATVWNTVQTIPDSETDENLKQVLHHLHVVQYAFYYIWLGLPLDFPEESEFKNLQELASWASEYPEKIQTYLRDLKVADMDRVIEVPWAKSLKELIGREPSRTTLAETMLQVIAHSSHHRGQICTRIRALNGEPPLVDFIAWVWLDKPSAVWP